MRPSPNCAAWLRRGEAPDHRGGHLRVVALGPGGFRLLRLALRLQQQPPGALTFLLARSRPGRVGLLDLAIGGEVILTHPVYFISI